MISIDQYRLRSLFFFNALILLAFSAGVVHASSQPYITSHQINFGSGNKYLSEKDVRIPWPGPQLSFTRTYNSQSDENSIMGFGWSASATERLSIATDEIILIQAGGRYVHFSNDGSGNWINETGSKRVITSAGDGYQLRKKSGTTKLFDSAGHLLSHTDSNGNSLTYTYTGADLTSISNSFGESITFTYTGGKISSVTSALGAINYDYDANNNLTTVTKWDNTTLTYIYDDPADVHNLTGIVNEEDVRTLTVEYNESDRVIRSAKTGGSNEVIISYPGTYQRVITNSLGVATNYTIDIQQGIVRVGSYTGPSCSTCGSSSDTSYVYDDRFQATQSTDGKGTITSYTYDDSGNKLTKIVATGTALEKITTYTYTAENRLETITEGSIANPGQSSVTTNSYDLNGNLLTRTETGFAGSLPISNVSTYTYNSTGQITTIDGPRTDVNDVTTLSYYANGSGYNSGNIHTITNALGHTTTYSSYNVHGLAETVTDSNGRPITRTYDSRGRLKTFSVGGLITTYNYNKAGELLSIIRPGNRTITYSYDNSGRVSAVTDSAGNSITYSYDSEGRNIGEQVVDPSDALKYFSNFEYDDAGQLTKVLLPGGAEESASYDEVGSLVQFINATGLQTDMDYDALQRLESIMEGTHDTGYMYDADSNLIQVTDARGNITGYGYDDFGQLLFRTSPESGNTSYSYDEAGNLSTINDALNRTVGFEYDILNRPTSQYYGDSDIVFSYDLGSNGVGKLSSITDEYGARSFSYNTLGQLTSEVRQIGTSSYTTSYSYSPETAELGSITYPSNHTIAYNRDTTGQVVSITLDGGTIISAITHLPFGPLASATLGSVPLTKSYDQRYNLQSIQGGSTLDYAYTRDAAGHVTSITNTPTLTASSGTEEYTYNSNNNQLTEKGTTSYTYDAVGNILTDGVHTFTYDELNRITQVEKEGQVVSQYGYDSSNRRLFKTVGGTTTHYHYNSSGNLIAETLADGTPLRDYIYLDGEPIVLNEYQNTPGLYYYLNDHLGTPQQLVTGTGDIVWQAAYLPFGNAQLLVEQVESNIRFPGQYFDSETGLHYNWNRYYDPDTGRYISADPIGLAGGMNLYAYVQNNPINWIDPWGLWQVNVSVSGGTGVVGGTAGISIGSNGVHGTIGGGWGVGLGASATVGTGQPSPGVSGYVDFSGGTGTWGGSAGGEYPISPPGSPSPVFGGGWGIGAGASAGVNWTFPIWAWNDDDDDC